MSDVVYETPANDSWSDFLSLPIGPYRLDNRQVGYPVEMLWNTNRVLIDSTILVNIFISRNMFWQISQGQIICSKY